MSSFRVLTRNIISSWFGYAVQVAVAFFLTPFILGAIGDARYGIWAIVLGITGYYGLLDLGLRAGMTQYITRYCSTGDWTRMNMAASSGFALHVCCATCVLLITVIVAYVAPVHFSISADLQAEMVWCVLVVGCATAVQFLLFPFSVALTAKQRFDVETAISIFARLSAAGATVWCLTARYGLIGLCVASSLGNIIDYCLRWSVAYRILPQLKISLRLVNWASCRECMVFGFWSALIAASTLLISFTDALVIGVFMPVSAIAFFVLANNLIKYFANIFVPVGYVFFPAATTLDARDDEVTLRRLYLTASRMIALLAVGMALIACFWATDFYALWVGNAYLDSSTYHAVPLLFRVLLVAAVCTAAQRIGSKILFGRRHIRGLAWLFICEGTLNLVLSIAFIRPYGLLGVALGTVIPAVICQGVLHPALVCAELHLSIRDYTREILRPAAVVISVLAPLLAFLHRITAHRTWGEMFLEGVVAMSCAAAVICIFGLTPSDRQRYLYPTAKRLFRFRPFALDAVTRHEQ